MKKMLKINRIAQVVFTAGDMDACDRRPEDNLDCVQFDHQLLKYHCIFAGAYNVKPEVERYLNFNTGFLDKKLKEDPSDPNSKGLEGKNRRDFTHYSESAENGPIFISIAFNKDVLPSSTVHDLQRSLKYVSLHKVPMPCFSYPYGWVIYTRTQRRNFKDGVTIASYQNGRLHFRVNTIFSYIYGIMSGFTMAADARIPSFAYFKITRNIRGTVDVNMPLVLA